MRMLALLLLLSLSACSAIYYAGLEKIGIPKRDLLTRRVERARDAQQDTKEQVGSALDRFRATVHVEGGDLEKNYDTLRSELEKSEQRAEQLGDRIDEVEDVADALFKEWEAELDQYKRADLRTESSRRLAQTRRDYKPMIDSMRRAQHKIEPVLDAFRDVVLSMKHQLNSRALTGMRGELANVEREVDALVREMNRSIEEASKFLGTLKDDDRSSAGLGSGANQDRAALDPKRC